MKNPEDCQNLSEIREAIDSIDQNIIKLLGSRFCYVKAASKFKKDSNAVKAPGRVKAMLEIRRNWAAENGLNPDFVEATYRNLIDYFVQEEMDKWHDSARLVGKQDETTPTGSKDLRQTN